MSSKIEQVIGAIEELIDDCKYQTFSNTNIIVNKEEIEALLRELKMKTPEEIKRYQKIINNKDAILADANEKAKSIIEAANVHKSELVSEHQIMQQAYAQANEIIQIAQNEAQQILDHATNDANNIRSSAIEYTDGLLANLENIIGHTVDTAGARYQHFIDSLQKCYDIVETNRIELNPPGEEEAADTVQETKSTEKRATEKKAGAEDYRVNVKPEDFE